MFHVERFIDGIFALRFHLRQNEDEEVGYGIVEDQIGAEGLGEDVDKCQAVQSLNDQQLSHFLYLFRSMSTFSLLKQSNMIAAKMMAPSSRQVCR